MKSGAGAGGVYSDENLGRNDNPEDPPPPFQTLEGRAAIWKKLRKVAFFA
jgi:hypothetical protein